MPTPSAVPDDSDGPGDSADTPDHEFHPPPDPWLLRVSQVDAEPVTWLWPGRVPFGKLTIIDGDPGLGKSTITLDLAARLTTGRPMPDSATPTCPPAEVVLLSSEDGVADTIRPRLAAAGAALPRVLVVDHLPSQLGTGPIRLPSHAPFLEAFLHRVGARLLIVDPLVAYLDAAINPHSDRDVRRALAPLARLAAHADAAVLVVRHLSKAASRNPLYRGGGSIGFIGAARSGLVVARHPDDPAGVRRVLASTKLNLGPPPPALVYRLVPNRDGVASVAWDGPTDYTAADVLAESARDQHTRAALDEARSILAALLADGPLPANQVRAEATHAGLGPHLLWRAKSALGVRSIKLGGRGQNGQRWVWSLPPRQQPPDGEDPATPRPKSS